MSWSRAVLSATMKLARSESMPGWVLVASAMASRRSW
jgi:hypothetical protein